MGEVVPSGVNVACVPPEVEEGGYVGGGGGGAQNYERVYVARTCHWNGHPIVPYTHFCRRW